MPKNLRYDVLTAGTDKFKEQTLGATPAVFQGSPVLMDFAFKDADGELIDLSDYTDITLEVWENQEDGERLLEKTIEAADFDLTCTLADWVAKTKQPVRFTLSGTELNFTIGAAKTEESFYIVVGGTPVDGEPETLGYSTIKMLKDRFGEPGTPVTEDPASYLTSAQSDARYVREFLVPMLFHGELTDEQAFGYFKARSACRVLGMQIAAQVAPVGAAVTIDLINAAAAEQTKIATLADGAAYQETLYDAALTLAAGDVLRAKVKSTGIATKGEWLTCHLLIAPTTDA